MTKQIFFSVVFLVLSIFGVKAQTDKNSDLFIELTKLDSIFFERGFNRCDLEYLESHVAEDLKFYHDQSGFQDRNAFFENTRKYICSDSEKKPIRKVEINSLEVFPLYNNGKLYGAIQNGIHQFYLKEIGKEEVWTGTAKFTHIWILVNGIWKLSEVLSYDHQDPSFKNSRKGVEK